MRTWSVICKMNLHARHLCGNPLHLEVPQCMHWGALQLSLTVDRLIELSVWDVP